MMHVQWHTTVKEVLSSRSLWYSFMVGGLVSAACQEQLIKSWINIKETHIIEIRGTATIST